MELTCGNRWLDRILSEMQCDSVPRERKDEALDWCVLEYGHAPYLLLICKGYEQEIETDKDSFTDTVYRIFFSFMQLFFLKKS